MKAFVYFLITSIILIIFLFCFCCAIWLGVIAIAAENTSSIEKNGYSFTENLVEDSKDSVEKIAVIKVSGIIFDGDLGPFGGATAQSGIINAQLDLALEDENVKAILLEIDSPGGEVIASDAIYRKLLEVKSQKPVVVYSKGLLASGAYYIAMGSDQIFVNEFNLSGSIGVYAEFYNYDGLYEKLGIEVKRLTNSNGTYKLGEQLYDDNENDEYEANLVKSLDVVYNRFLDVIISSRGISEETLKESLAKGQVFDAYSAKENNLIDEIGTESDAWQYLLDTLEIQSADKIEYQQNVGFWEFFATPAIQFKNMFNWKSEIRVFYI